MCLFCPPPSLAPPSEPSSRIWPQRRGFLLATGAALVCYASGKDEEEAVRETVAILKQAGLSPIEVTGHGTIEERLAEGHEIPEEERVLMDRALAENAVIVAQMEPLYGDEDDRDDDGDEG